MSARGNSGLAQLFDENSTASAVVLMCLSMSVIEV